MKSIMKLAERDAGHAALTAPRHQQHHNQFQSSLPNGKIELMWFVAADGAWRAAQLSLIWFVGYGRSSAKATSQRRRRAGCGGNTLLFFHFTKKRSEIEKKRQEKRAGPLIGLIFGGLRAAASRRQPAKKRDKQRAVEFSLLMDGIEWR